MVTHESAKVDVQSKLNSLIERFDKEKKTKDHYKEKIEQLTTVL